ncbi:MAG: Ppx/GppA phosphatase family protein [Planctomycetota bacterium]
MSTLDANADADARRAASAAPHPATTGPLRLAAIDVGTNSIRLIVAEHDGEGGYRILDDEKVTPRLGHGLGETGMIAPDRIEQAIDAIERMKQIAIGYGVAEIRVIGTSAAREARNGQELIEGVRRVSNLAMQVIGPDEEGRLAHKSVVGAFDVAGRQFAVADIGGGSTELVFSRAGAIEKIVGLKIGAVRMTERFGGADGSRGEHFEEMRQFLRGSIEAAVGRLPLRPTVLYGTGGTYAALAAIHQASIGRPIESVQGQRLSRAEVGKTLDAVRELIRRGKDVPGLSKDRYDIIVPGAAIVEALMDVLAAPELVVHDRGIRDGLMLEMIHERTRRRPPAQAGRSASLRRFARTCRYHEAHSEHVTGLALQIFDQLAERVPALAGELAPQAPAHPIVLDGHTGLDAEARTLLEAAGVLHDIGYLVNHSKHHKHSYYIIANSELDGYGPRERELIANIARYHRRSHPKPSHDAYAALDAHERKVVRRLAAILRVADGLDRTHTQIVERVVVRIDGNSVVFVVDAPTDVATDIWGAQRKSELFTQAFGLRCRFEIG